MSKENSTKCHICNKLIGNNGFPRHLKFIHNLTSKKYYDTYRKIDDNEELCLKCLGFSKFKNVRDGYQKFCSSKCGNTHKETNKIRGRKISKTLKENPTIIERRINLFKETLNNNPEIQEKINKNIHKWAEENPDKVQKRNEKIKEIYINNPEIILKRNEKIKETLNDNPEIINKRVVLYKKWVKENPNKIKERGKKHSIYLRNNYNQLVDPDCTIPHYLYIIQNLEKPIIKIGRSENPEKRLYKIIKDFGPSKIVHTLKGPYNKIQPLESYLHDKFNDYCLVQESGNGRTEWFCEEILGEVVDIASSC